MYLDGFLYVLIAISGGTALGAVWAGEEAARYIQPASLFWLKTICTVVFAGATALKTFRSTAFADHQAEQVEIKEAKAAGVEAKEDGSVTKETHTKTTIYPNS